MSKKLSKDIATVDYFDKSLIAVSATSGGVSIISFVSVIGASLGKAGASISLVLPLTTGIIKKLWSITWSKKKKNNKIFVLAKSKLNSIKTLISQGTISIY